MRYFSIPFKAPRYKLMPPVTQNLDLLQLFQQDSRNETSCDDNCWWKWGRSKLSWPSLCTYAGAKKGTWLMMMRVLFQKQKHIEGPTLLQRICYSHWANGARNGVISIGQRGVFNHEKGAIWQSHLAAQKEGVVTTIIFSNHKTY